MAIDTWVYHVVVDGCDYYVKRNRAMSNILINTLAEMVTITQLQWFIKEYGCTISKSFDVPMDCVQEEEFVNGAFL